MMNYFNASGALAVGFHLHALFGFIFFTGLILFIVWAVKNLKKESATKWIIWLLVVGALGALLTAPVTARMWGKGGFKGYMMKGGTDKYAPCLSNDVQ